MGWDPDTCCRCARRDIDTNKNKMKGVPIVQSRRKSGGNRSRSRGPPTKQTCCPSSDATLRERRQAASKPDRTKPPSLNPSLSSYHSKCIDPDSDDVGLQSSGGSVRKRNVGQSGTKRPMVPTASQSTYHSKCLQPVDLGTDRNPFPVPKKKTSGASLKKCADKGVGGEISHGSISTCSREKTASAGSGSRSKASSGGSSRQRCRCRPKTPKPAETVSQSSCKDECSEKVPPNYGSWKSSEMSACSRCGQKALPRDPCQARRSSKQDEYRDGTSRLSNELRFVCKKVPKMDLQLLQRRVSEKASNSSLMRKIACGKAAASAARTSRGMSKCPCQPATENVRQSQANREYQSRSQPTYRSKPVCPTMSPCSMDGQRNSTRRQAADPYTCAFDDCSEDELSDIGSEAFFESLRDNVECAVKKSTEEIFGCYFNTVIERLDNMADQMRRTDGRICKIYKSLADKLADLCETNCDSMRFLTMKSECDRKFFQEQICKLGKALNLPEFGGCPSSSGMACDPSGQQNGISIPLPCCSPPSGGCIPKASKCLKQSSNYSMPSECNKENMACNYNSTYQDEISKPAAIMSNLSLMPTRLDDGGPDTRNNRSDPILDRCGATEDLMDDNASVLLCVIDKRSHTDNRKM